MYEQLTKQSHFLVNVKNLALSDHSSFAFYFSFSLESVAHSYGIGSWTGKKGLDTMIANNRENVSAGEKQRIILARALIRKKNILLFEEVTSHLDPESAGKIEKRILKDPKLTVFFVKHGDVERENLFDGILEMAENGEWPLKENRTL
ncbi:MAG: ATP-binding cassette domain-containing protein [Peptoniphilaceae bacterium]|nr:ATP-binding cassette domain-containing protein [Peptoniphilaceae bacterium]